MYKKDRVGSDIYNWLMSLGMSHLTLTRLGIGFYLSGLSVHRQMYTEHVLHYKHMLNTAKNTYFANTISMGEGNTKRLFLTVKRLLKPPVPSSLKKTGLDCSDLNNYRPISNLPFISKILERVVATQLQTYLQDNNLFEQFQSGIHSRHSTKTALVKITNNLLHAADAGLILLELSAAFDTISNQLLLKRLESMGSLELPLSGLLTIFLNGHILCKYKTTNQRAQSSNMESLRAQYLGHYYSSSTYFPLAIFSDIMESNFTPMQLVPTCICPPCPQPHSLQAPSPPLVMMLYPSPKRLRALELFWTVPYHSLCVSVNKTAL